MKKTPATLFCAATLLALNLFADQTADAPIAAAADQTTLSGPCDTLPTDQQAFSSQLSATNKSVFCSQFSPAQRMSAMQMSGTPGANGIKMTPDQAVEQVAKSGTLPQKSTGGCPVR